nr:hypothetical protein [uncultured Draconibacterium sp.]
MPKYGKGIVSVKFGTPTGSASMPGTLNAWAQTVEGSMNFSEEEAQTVDFNVEETTAPVDQAQTDAGGLTIQWRAYDMTPAMMAIVKGGTAGTDTGVLTYDAPASNVAQKLALEVTMEDGVVFNIYKANVFARIDGQAGRGTLLEVSVSAVALDPGDGGSPWGYKTSDS